MGMSFFIMVLIFVGKIIINKLSLARGYSTNSRTDQAILTKLLFFNMTCNVIVPYIFALYIARE
jgi:hypothetical protein